MVRNFICWLSTLALNCPLTKLLSVGCQDIISITVQVARNVGTRLHAGSPSLSSSSRTHHSIVSYVYRWASSNLPQPSVSKRSPTYPISISSFAQSSLTFTSINSAQPLSFTTTLSQSTTAVSIPTPTLPTLTKHTTGPTTANPQPNAIVTSTARPDPNSTITPSTQPCFTTTTNPTTASPSPPLVATLSLDPKPAVPKHNFDRTISSAAWRRDTATHWTTRVDCASFHRTSNS